VNSDITTVTQIIKAQGQDLTQKQDSTFYFEYTPVDQKDAIKGTMEIDFGTRTQLASDGKSPAPGAIDTFKRRFLPDAQYKVSTVQSWKDAPDPRNSDAGLASARRRNFGGPQRQPPPSAEQRPSEWKLIEITARE
jgi:hypothetical protein